MADHPESSSDSSQRSGYVMDAENAAEMARLMLMDRSLNQAMGGPLAEQLDLSGIHQVLDIGCGPGGWLFDVVERFPHFQAVGIDISQLMIEYANSQAASLGFSNLSFRVMDATQPLGFPDNTFDLVNGRILVGFLSKQQWPQLLSECYRITKPGGILRLTEAEWGFTNSQAFDKLMEIETLALHRAGHTFSPRGRTFGMTPALRLLLQQADYHLVGHRAYEVDYSAGTPIHQNYTQNVLVLGRMLEAFFVQMQLATQAELEAIGTQMEEEMSREDFCALDYYLTVWGRKPEN
jgi:ubiquinone/menaquinone biosynthesis C-methylase UbiE